MRYRASCLTLLVLAGCASPPAEVKPVPATRFAETASPVVTLAEARRLGYRIADENGQTVYCRDQIETGSHLRKDTICLTAEQLAVARDASKHNLEQLERMIPPPACGPFSKIGC